MDDLAAFLRARLDEDEAAATPGRRALDGLRFELKRGDPYEQHLSSRIEDGLDTQTMAWQARVLREVEAKRAILAEYEEAAQYPYDLPEGVREGRDDDERELDAAQIDILEGVLRHLAAVYRDHRHYRDEWKP